MLHIKIHQPERHELSNMLMKLKTAADELHLQKQENELLKDAIVRLERCKIECWEELEQFRMQFQKEMQQCDIFWQEEFVRRDYEFNDRLEQCRHFCREELVEREIECRETLEQCRLELQEEMELCNTLCTKKIEQCRSEHREEHREELEFQAAAADTVERLLRERLDARTEELKLMQKRASSAETEVTKATIAAVNAEEMRFELKAVRQELEVFKASKCSRASLLLLLLVNILVWSACLCFALLIYHPRLGRREACAGGTWGERRNP